jgi:NAD+ synthase (glutamine-hydrolysing)
LLSGSLAALNDILKASANVNLVSVVGMPLQVDHLPFNCAVVLSRGKILGVVPKTYLPNYREFYEYRQFAPAAAARSTTVDVLGQHDIPFGEHLLFELRENPQVTFFVEICEDL